MESHKLKTPEKNSSTRKHLSELNKIQENNDSQDLSRASSPAGIQDIENRVAEAKPPMQYPMTRKHNSQLNQAQEITHLQASSLSPRSASMKREEKKEKWNTLRSNDKKVDKWASFFIEKRPGGFRQSPPKEESNFSKPSSYVTVNEDVKKYQAPKLRSIGVQVDICSCFCVSQKLAKTKNMVIDGKSMKKV